MNKKLKMVSLLILFLLIGTIAVQAVTVSKESIKKNLENYSIIGKVASAVVGNSKYTVGGDAARISSIAVTDDTITFSSSNTPLIYKYKIEGNICTFTAETDLTASTTTNEYLTETLKINLLSACFLVVTDSDNMDSNNALYYYIDKVEKTKLNVNYDGIDNQNIVAIGRRYIENVGRVDDVVFNQYTRILSNTDTNCKYETVLEIKLDQVSQISVDRPATNSSPTTQPNTNTTANPSTTTPQEPNTNAVPATNTTANYVTGSNTLDTEINNELIKNITGQIDQNPDSSADVGEQGKVQGNNVLKVIVILMIIGLVVVAIVRFEMVRKQK